MLFFEKKLLNLLKPKPLIVDYIGATPFVYVKIMNAANGNNFFLLKKLINKQTQFITSCDSHVLYSMNNEGPDTHHV